MKDGTFKGGIALKGMEVAAIDFSVNPARSSKISADVLKQVEDAKEKLRKGELMVPKDEF